MVGLVSRPILMPSSSLGLPSFVLPPFPPFVRESQARVLGLQFFPLGMKLSSDHDYWYFPQEPYVGISGSNTMSRRAAAKSSKLTNARGTVKERWAQDDYKITITGTIKGKDEAVYPREAVERLRTYCENRAEAISVICPLFEIFGITQMVIESFDIPFTPGENMQTYTINAYSDFAFSLFVSTK